MLPDVRLLVICLMIPLAACSGWSGLSGRKPSAQASAMPSQADIVTANLELIDSLLTATDARKLEIAESARLEYLRSPSPSGQLRYACVLSTPGHPQTNLFAASSLLEGLLAAPQRLGSAELALARVLHQDVEQRLSLESELRDLRTSMQNAEQERAAAAARRLQAQVAENARLRRELDEALAKLEAIAELERHLVNRPAPNGDKP